MYVIQIITQILYWKDDYGIWLLQSERRLCQWLKLFWNAKKKVESIDRFHSPHPRTRSDLHYTSEEKKNSKY